MRVVMVLPALTEATSPYFRPVKYALFPPIGLATLAGYLDEDDDVVILDEHVEPVDVERIMARRPQLVVIQVYITSARRSYQLADALRLRGVRVALGGLHPTSLPDEAAAHADHVFVGPGEDTWPAFLADLRAGSPLSRYVSSERTLVGAPPARRDLIRRSMYLVPNSLVVSRGCPHHCDCCYKDAFFMSGGARRSFYTQQIDDALAQIDALPGRHLYFLDDHLFGNRRFAHELFSQMRGMGRVWQAAATVDSVLAPGLLEEAVEAGLRSLFVGFETVNAANLPEQRKRQNVGRDYGAVVRRLHDAGVMVNASFVFGMDDDGPDVFDRTVEWAVENGVETATFHVMTPYPGTGLYRRLSQAGRVLHHDWDRYDTRHVVYRPTGMTAEQIERGYWGAYRDFYRWSSIWRSATQHEMLPDRVRHMVYAAGWKKFEPLWDMVIRAHQVVRALPLLESLLGAFGARRSAADRVAAPTTTTATSGLPTARVSANAPTT